MGDLASYTLADLLMFSPATYARQFALLNAQLWPLHLFLIALAGLAASPRRLRLPAAAAFALLAPAWLATAWWFLYQRFAAISFTGEPFALLFAAQALLLAGAAALGAGVQAAPRRAARLAWALFVYALVVHPLLGLATGREAGALEWFGLAPDATALATLGLLLTRRGAAVAWLALIPMAWCLFSGLTHLAMATPIGVLTPSLAVTILVMRLLLARPTTAATGD